MKILRYEFQDEIQVGLLVNQKVTPFPSKFGNDTINIISKWDEIKLELEIYTENKGEEISLADIDLLAPIDSPSKFLAIGLNYKKHRQETIDSGITPPRNQMWFTKQTSCINSPYGNIIKPDATMMLDYEVELAFIVGKKCYQVSAEEAQDYIFGYMVCNDISMRDWQLHNMPDRLELMIGKSHDTHGPPGPWIVTRDEVEDPHKLKLECFVNGNLRQSSNTDDMIWNC